MHARTDRSTHRARHRGPVTGVRLWAAFASAVSQKGDAVRGMPRHLCVNGSAANGRRSTQHAAQDTVSCAQHAACCAPLRANPTGHGFRLAMAALADGGPVAVSGEAVSTSHSQDNEPTAHSHDNEPAPHRRARPQIRTGPGSWDASAPLPCLVPLAAVLPACRRQAQRAGRVRGWRPTRNRARRGVVLRTLLSVWWWFLSRKRRGTAGNGGERPGMAGKAGSGHGHRRCGTGGPVPA